MDRRTHIKTLDYIISQTHVEAYRSALVAARNRLDQDERQERAGIRAPNDWPYCAKCGAAYIAQPTTGMYTRAVIPSCSCEDAGIAWYGRPAGSEVWEYEIDPALISDAESSWERFGAMMIGGQVCR